MTCKDCIHYEICKMDGTIIETKKCEYFKDKSKFIELPCKVGGTMYVIDEPLWKDEFNQPYQIDVYDNCTYDTILGYVKRKYFGRCVFATNDINKAEAKLKELNENG